IEQQSTWRPPMAAKPFASSADLGVKEQTLEVLADGVYALTAEGDPNLGAIEAEDFLVCFEAPATPGAARRGARRRRVRRARGGRPHPGRHRGRGLPRLLRGAGPPGRPPPLAGQA